MASKRVVTVKELTDILSANGGSLKFASNPPEGFAKYPEGLTPDLEKDAINRIRVDYKEYAQCMVHHDTQRVFGLKINSRPTFEDPLLYLRVTNKLRDLLRRNDIPFLDEDAQQTITNTRQYLEQLEAEVDTLERQLPI